MRTIWRRRASLRRWKVSISSSPRLSVYDVAALGERFDIVFFIGVLYHLRHPLLALDLIHEHAAKDLLVFQSMQRGSDAIMQLREDYEFWETAIFDDPAFPKLHFIEHSYAHDPTNWWAPNRACAAAMVRSAGFTIGPPGGGGVHLSPNRAERGRLRGRLSGSGTAAPARVGKP